MALAVLRRPAAGPPATSALRALLAEKIAAYEQAKTTHRAIVSALAWEGAAEQAIRKARERLADAETALEAAKQGAADHVLNASMGGAGGPAPDTKSAHAEIQAAQDAIDAAISARDTLKARLEPAENSVGTAEIARDAAIDAVIRAHVAPHFGAFLEEINNLYRLAAEKSNLLELLLARALPTTGPAMALAHPDTLQTKCRFTSMPFSWVDSRPENSALCTKWKAAMEALKTDATAPLPEGFDL